MLREKSRLACGLPTYFFRFVCFALRGGGGLGGYAPPKQKSLTDEEAKDFVAINFSEKLKSVREKQNLRKVAKSLTASDEK